MDDDYGADDDLLAAMAATDLPSSRPTQPTPQKVTQPIPQRMDRPPPRASDSNANKIVQPTPQTLPKQVGGGGGSAILVSPRQKGNPVIAAIKKVGWEYSDIPADYVLGATTCALFLSLKYHRLHPEYIYTRIKNLGTKYHLRLVITLIDIPNHEDPLRELSKTSLVNNVTLILCWSAAEAAHYLELYKSHENAGFAAIKGVQSNNYADRLTDFVTVPRGVNKSDAVALVANFGSLRNAVGAGAEELGMMGGWGGVKVKRWVKAVDEPFRTQGGSRRGLLSRENTTTTQGGREKLERAVPLERVPLREMSSFGTTPTPQGEEAEGESRKEKRGQFRFADDDLDDDDEEEEEALMAMALAESQKEVDRTSQARASQRQEKDTPAQAVAGQEKEASEAPPPPPPRSEPPPPEELSGGIAAALARLRDGG